MIYLARHGQPYIPGTEDATGDPDYPPGDPPLSELGREQARRLGERLLSLGFSGSIYASPYRRTFETADVIAEVLGTTVFPEPAIREYTGPAIVSFRGATLEELRAAYPRLDRAARLSHPWWTLEPEEPDESRKRPAVTARVGGFIESLLPQEEGTDALLVGHGASVGAAIRLFMERIPLEEQPSIGTDWNCALTTLRYHPRAGLDHLFCVDHLLPEQVTSNRRTAAEILDAIAASKTG